MTWERVVIRLRRFWGWSFGVDPRQALRRHNWREGEAEGLLLLIQELPETDPGAVV